MLPAKVRSFYRPELDVLRFLAFLSVFLHHSAWTLLSPGAMAVGYGFSGGVQIFFVLSSYLITELLLREKGSTGTIKIRAFFARRILRIWPLYLFVMFGVYIAYKFKIGYFPDGALPWFLLLSGNWWVYLNNFTGSMIGPLWSISIEEQFYLVWPFLLLWGGRKTLKVAIALVLAMFTAAVWYSGHFSLAEHKFWTNSFIEFGFFAVGAVLALVLHGRDWRAANTTRVVLFAGWLASFLLTVYVFPIMPTGAQTTPRLFGMFLALNAECVFLFLLMYGMRLPRWANFLAYLGRISYGLYVYHWPALSVAKHVVRMLHLTGPVPAALAQLPIGLGIAIAIAAISFRCLEQPFLKLKRRFATDRTPAELQILREVGQ